MSIQVSIDLSKIDKSKIKVGKNGGKYLNIVVAEMKKVDQFGQTHTVYLQQTPEEREAKTERIYIGKGKEWRAITVDEAQNLPNMTPDNVDDLPF